MSYILDIEHDDDYQLPRSCSVGGRFLARERGAFITRPGGTELDVNDVRLDCVIKGIVGRGVYEKWKPRTKGTKVR